MHHLFTTHHQATPILEWFGSIMPVTTDPPSQPRGASRAARMLPARTTRLQPPARALLLQSQTIAARLVTLSPRDQRVSAALRRAAAPYADGCEQIFGRSQPISY